MDNNRRRYGGKGAVALLLTITTLEGYEYIRHTHNRSRETKIKIKKLYIFIIPLQSWGNARMAKKQVVVSNKMVINLVHWTERIP